MHNRAEHMAMLNLEMRVLPCQPLAHPSTQRVHQVHWQPGRHCCPPSVQSLRKTQAAGAACIPCCTDGGLPCVIFQPIDQLGTGLECFPASRSIPVRLQCAVKGHTRKAAHSGCRYFRQQLRAEQPCMSLHHRPCTTVFGTCGRCLLHCWPAEILPRTTTSSVCSRQA